MTADLDRWRRDTVGTAHCIHLNNAGAALMPRPVVEAIQRHITLEAEIGGYEAADACASALTAGYDTLGRIVGARGRNIAVVGNATAAFTQAMSCFDWSAGDVIVTSHSDYISNQIQYLALRKRLGVELCFASDLPEGGVDAASVEQSIKAAGSAKRVVVAISWIPTNSGLVQDVASVGEVCERHEVPFIVDACQAVGQMPIDVDAVKCDYLTGTARKFLRGPRGVGFLYASDRALRRGDHPLYVDMRGARWTSPESYEVAESARRYEDWEFPYALVLGQTAAAEYALEIGLESARDRAWSLAATLRAGLRAIPGVRVLDRGATPCAIVTATIDGIDAALWVDALRKERINCVVSRREFAQYDFGEKGVESAIRLSPHYYNSEEEIETALEATRAFVRTLHLPAQSRRSPGSL